jgi:putative salt-induced outer membrane protein YdiY
MIGIQKQLKYMAVLAAAGCVVAGGLRAQEAVKAEAPKADAPKAEAPKNPWERSVSLGLSLTTGNSDTLLFVGAFEAKRVWEHDEFRGLITGAYGETEDEKSTETAEALAQYKHLFSERFYGTLYGNLFHDAIADVAYRLTLSPGVGYYFIKSPKTQLSADIGPSYVIEKLNGQEADDYVGLRLAERWDHKINDAAKVWQSLEWLPQIDDFENYILIFEVGIETSLTQALKLRVVGQDRYDNQPAPGRQSNDISLVSSLAYKF